MSRYPTKTELIDTVRESIVQDSAGTGLPTDPAAYNFTGVLRDLNIIGDSTNGWTFEHQGREAFVAALASNLRPHLAPPTPAPAPARPAPYAAVVKNDPDSDQPSFVTVHPDRDSALTDAIETMAGWVGDDGGDLTGPLESTYQQLLETCLETDGCYVTVAPASTAL